MDQSAKILYSFGDFRLDPSERLLLRNGEPLPLAPKVFDALILLVENAGHLVEKDQFMERLWPTTFVGEDTLAQNISLLRKILSAGGSGDDYVATIPKRGYRFTAAVVAIKRGHEKQVVSVDKPDFAAAASEAPVSGLVEPTRRHLTGHLAAGTPRDYRFGWSKLVVVSSIVALLACAGTYFAVRPRLQNELRVWNFERLTNDILEKAGPLSTDGTRVYLTEGSLKQVSVKGGEVIALPTTLKAQVVDISPDGTELLVINDEPEGSSSLWIQPVAGGAPRRVGDLVVESACWGPDEETLAYSKGQQIFRVRKDGTNAREVLSVQGIPQDLRFSPDGTKLRFTLTSDQGRTTSLWEASSYGEGLHPLLPNWNMPAAECCGNWMADGKYFVFVSVQDGRKDLWFIREQSGSGLRRAPRPERLTTGPVEFSYPVSSKDSRTLFAIGQIFRAEIVRFDLVHHRLVPFLPGISAEGLDFSRDGQWVTYTSYPGGMLWRSKIDGSQRLQLTFPPNRALLPRWSPDGRQIAFMSSPPRAPWELGGPWKIQLISADGGTPQQLLLGEHNEADPTWSADGKSIAFGRIPWPETVGQTHAGMDIQIIDIKTRQLSKVPGSDGLFSPRWSPDGRFIVAVEDSHPMRPHLFDFATKKWVLLADSDMGYQSWSRDSKYICLQDWNHGQPRIARLRLRDHALEGLLSFTQIESPMAGTITGWSGLAPDGSPLVARDISHKEIYALKLAQ